MGTQGKHPLDVTTWFIKRVFPVSVRNNLSSAMQLDRHDIQQVYNTTSFLLLETTTISDCRVVEHTTLF